MPEVKIAHLGTGQTKSDTVVWLPSEKVERIASARATVERAFRSGVCLTA